MSYATQACSTVLDSGMNSVAPLLPEGFECIVPASSVVRITFPCPEAAAVEVSSKGDVDLYVPPMVFLNSAGVMGPVGRLSNDAEMSVSAPGVGVGLGVGVGVGVGVVGVGVVGVGVVGVDLGVGVGVGVVGVDPG